VRRGSRLRLRVAIADDAFAEVGDELGALLRRIAPTAVSTSVIEVPSNGIEVIEPGMPAEIVIAKEHMTDDETYHVGLRQQLAVLFSSLCDASLADAAQVLREEHARRTEGN